MTPPIRRVAKSARRYKTRTDAMFAHDDAAIRRPVEERVAIEAYARGLPAVAPPPLVKPSRLPTQFVETEPEDDRDARLPPHLRRARTSE